MKHSYRTWLEIDYAAITKNTALLKGLLSDETSLMAVVKSNAYGHGMLLSAKAALKGGAERLAVDEISEALELRKAGIKAPILVLGYTLPALYKDAVAKNIALTISSLESLQTLSKTKISHKLSIHLKFDTGLHRQGILESRVQQVLRIICAKGFPAIVEGAYTHFAAMEDPAHESYSRSQLETFKRIVAMLEEKGLAPITHVSASSGILFSSDFHADMVRGGIALYGLWPSPEIQAHAVKMAGKSGIRLAPALSWKAIVSEVKLISKGASVGYDLTHTVSRDSRIAIIPVGYWHGLRRSLSNSGHVLIGGKRCPIIGRISMDMTIIDVTDVPSVKQGDEAVIIGKQGKEVITVEGVAEKAGTINYEIVTQINPLLPRIAL